MLGAAALGGLGAVGVALGTPVLASDLVLHPPKLPWSHSGWITPLDMARLVCFIEMVSFIVDQQTELDFYSGSSLRQQPTGRHDVPL